MTPAKPPLGGLKAIFLDHRPALAKLLAARLGSRADAENILHDIWAKLDTLPAGPIAQPVPYLYRMAASHAAALRVTQARDAMRQSLRATGDEIHDLEQILVSRERLGQVEAVIAVMPDRMRQALRMARLEGAPQREIAARLGMTVSDVGAMLQRCYKILIAADQDRREDESARRRVAKGEPF